MPKARQGQPGSHAPGAAPDARGSMALVKSTDNGRQRPAVLPPSAHQAAADVVELVEIAVANGQGTALAGPWLDLDLEPQDVAKVLLEGSRVGILVGAAPAAGGLSAFADVLHQSLDRPHVQILGDDALR